MAMTPLQLFQTICFLLMLLDNGDAFLTPISVTMVRQQRYCFIKENSLGCPTVVFSSVGSRNNNDAEGDEKSSSMSYDEADVSLKSEDEKRRLDNQGFGLTDEVRIISMFSNEKKTEIKRAVKKDVAFRRKHNFLFPSSAS
jgi:hypothetical protein